MWWKMVLLVVLGSPLLYRAWQELGLQPDSVQARIALPTRESLAARKLEQKRIAGEVEGSPVDEDLARVVLRGSQENVPASPRRTGAIQELAKQQNEHAEAIEQVRLFGETFIDLETNPGKQTRCTQPTYLTWIEARKKEVEPVKKTLEALQGRLASFAQKVPVVLQSREVDDLAGRQEEARTLVREMTEHRAASLAFTSLRDALERKRTEAMAYEKLLGISHLEEKDKLLENDQREKILDHLGRYDRLIRSEDVPADVVKLARTHAVRFCMDYLPGELKKEDRVLFYYQSRVSGPKADPVPFEKVHVRWKTGEVVPLNKVQGCDVFTFPPEEKVGYFILQPEGDPGKKIETTPLNRLVRYYNAKRKGLQINSSSLETFLNDAPVRWEGDGKPPQAVQRIWVVMEALKDYPRLFAPRN